MNNGWEQSAHAWITDMGDHGDFARRYILDPVMLPRALARSPRSALDIGCGEGRFCRLLDARGIATTGIDPTPTLISTARRRHPHGLYIQADAERLPLPDSSFDLIVSYLSLIDIPDIAAAITEMARVLQPGGALLIANLNSFNTACADLGWIEDSDGRRLHYPVDRYLEERAIRTAWRGIDIVNHHRPFSTYMRLLLDSGLQLTWFDEPRPTPDAPPHRAAYYVRAPWMLTMEWTKPVPPR